LYWPRSVRESPASDAIVALWKDGLAERVEVQPLSLDDLGELLTVALQGPIDGATIHLFRERTQGNALFLRELVLSALETRTLRREEGIWRLTGPLPTSSRLIEILDARLGRLDEEVRETLEVVGVGEPLEVEILQKIEAGIELDTLEQRCLANIHRDGRRLVVRLHHPLYGEVLRARLSPLRRRTYARELAGVLEATGARRREDVLRLATWQLEGGGAFKPEIMQEAANDARNRHDYPLAERLARAAVEAGAGFEADLLLGQVFWHQGRGEEANEHLSRLVARATTDVQRAMLASARVTVLDLGLKRPDEALLVAEETAAAIKDPAFRDEIDVERARVLGRTGHHAAAAELVRPILNRATGRTLISAAFAAGTSMPLVGRITETLEATERGLAAHLALTGPPWTFSPNIHLGFRSFALWNAGRLPEAWALGTTEYDHAVEKGALDAQGFFSAFLAGVALAQGRVATAARLARQAAATFRQVGIPMMLRGSLFFLAHALACGVMSSRPKAF
jgi:hypothetical protein